MTTRVSRTELTRELPREYKNRGATGKPESGGRESGWLKHQRLIRLPYLRAVTVVYGVLGERRQTFTRCNAGHNPPLLLRKDGRLEELAAVGMLKGAFREIPYEERQAQLGPGDCILSYTDGLTEAVIVDGGELGQRKLRQFPPGIAGSSASGIVQKLIVWASLYLAAGPPDDDFSRIIVRIVGLPG